MPEFYGMPPLDRHPAPAVGSARLRGAGLARDHPLRIRQPGFGRRAQTAQLVGRESQVRGAEVVLQLRERGRRASTIAEKVPLSLRALAYDVPVSTRAAERITQRLAHPAAALLV